MLKIAFIFLIYKTINHEELWLHSLKMLIRRNIIFIIHYKNDVKLKYFDDYKINKTISIKC